MNTPVERPAASANAQPQHWAKLDEADRDALLMRPALRDDDAVRADVEGIVTRVRSAGDRALAELTRELDRADVADCRVGHDEFIAAEAALDASAVAAIERAIANVRRFHEAQMPRAVVVDTAPGVRCERITQPLDAVGLYVPAGSAPLPSTAIMLCVPATIAGCPERVLCTPPRADGSADPAVLVAARRAGVDRVFKVGGAQAIAAMAYGTESIPRVARIFGPGNAWVTAAKRYVATDPAGASIDMPAGPSEVLVIADAAADPRWVAADLLSQAEHGTDSQAVLISTCEEVADAVLREAWAQVESLPRRDIASVALDNSRYIVATDLGEAVAISNRYAPEHLILHVEAPRALLPSIRNAGSVFVGPWSPESVGDYCSGTNHVLPTYGAARSYSSLGLDQFMRHMTVQELTREGLAHIGPTVIELAQLEGLEGHARAVRLRLESAGSRS
ncbi:MAG: histidinol dehydrogenase [Woeseiaceae bacterium]|nr:histidinol dehydrogenase [Woeseiaceae bacterium]